jgi:hypothetical protein
MANDTESFDETSLDPLALTKPEYGNTLNTDSGGGELPGITIDFGEVGN